MYASMNWVSIGSGKCRSGNDGYFVPRGGGGGGGGGVKWHFKALLLQVDSCNTVDTLFHVIQKLINILQANAGMGLLPDT